MVVVEEDKGDIVFRFRANDVTLIDTLFIPIFSQKEVENIEKDTFDFLTANSSGPYIFISQDDKKRTFLLRKNPRYREESIEFYFDQVRLGFSPSHDELEDIIDADITLSDTPGNSTVENNPYIRPIFYGVFLNTKTVPRDLRFAIFEDILKKIDTKDSSLKSQENIFL